MQRQICTGKENVKRHKECCVMTDEEIGVLHVPADEHQELLAMLEARREARNRFSLKLSETTWPCRHHDIKLLAFRTERINSCCFK